MSDQQSSTSVAPNEAPASPWTVVRPLDTYERSMLRARAAEFGLDAYPHLIEGLLPVGAVILYGRAGAGKSTFAAQLEEHMAWGTSFGDVLASPERRHCLVVDFEGNASVTYEQSVRITPTLPGDPWDEGLGSSPEHKIWHTVLRGRTFAERYAELLARLDEATSNGVEFGYVRIDTLRAFIGPRPEGLLAPEWDMAALGPLNDEMYRRGVCCLLIHHPNKQGDMSGSTSLAASVTTVIEIKRGVNRHEGVIRSTKNRVGPEFEYAASFDGGVWRMRGDLSPAQVRARGGMRDILDVLAEGPKQLAEIVAALPGRANIKRDLWRLGVRGDVDHDEGLHTWALTRIAVPSRAAPEPVSEESVMQRVAAEQGLTTPAEPERWRSPGELAAAEMVAERPVRARAAGPANGAGVTLDLSPVQQARANVLAGMTGKDACALMVKAAVPAAMALLAETRRTGRYDVVAFPPLPAVFTRPSRGRTDLIWEGRQNWVREMPPDAVTDAEVVYELDVNAAFLAALKTHLPLGRLEHHILTEQDQADARDRRRSGVYLIDPVHWGLSYLPSPLGNRESDEPVWITRPTLDLLYQLAREQVIVPPVVRESWTSGSTENLLEGMRVVLRDARAVAIDTADELAYAYVKNVYSKFVATIGDSNSNWEIKRPDWQHIIRAQAYANLWRKAHKAVTSGLHVVRVSNVDELHVVGEPAAVFTLGRALGELKVKNTYAWAERAEYRRARG